MNSALLTNLVKELSQISIKHDNCLEESLKLYQNKDYEDRELEPTISNVVSIDRPIDSKEYEEIYEEFIDIKFDENGFMNEINGSINTLLIESSSDIEI